MWSKRIGNNRLGAGGAALAALCLASVLSCSDSRDRGGTGAALAGEPVETESAVSTPEAVADGLPVASVRGPRGRFVLEEATIADIQQAILARRSPPPIS